MKSKDLDGRCKILEEVDDVEEVGDDGYDDDDDNNNMLKYTFCYVVQE
jgi:hypothetical protein